MSIPPMPVLFSRFLFVYILVICFVGGGHKCLSVCVGVRGQLSKISSLPTPGSLALRSEIVRLSTKCFRSLSRLINPAFVFSIQSLTLARADPELTIHSLGCPLLPATWRKHYSYEPPQPVAHGAFVGIHRYVRLHGRSHVPS